MRAALPLILGAVHASLLGGCFVSFEDYPVGEGGATSTAMAASGSAPSGSGGSTSSSLSDAGPSSSTSGSAGGPGNGGGNTGSGGGPNVCAENAVGTYWIAARVSLVGATPFLFEAHITEESATVDALVTPYRGVPLPLTTAGSVAVSAFSIGADGALTLTLEGEIPASANPIDEQAVAGTMTLVGTACSADGEPIARFCGALAGHIDSPIELDLGSDDTFSFNGASPENIIVDCAGTVAPAPPCPEPGTYPCEWGGFCVPLANICDGLDDCENGSDEEGCFGCAPDEFACALGGCINLSQACNGTAECPYGDDEDPSVCDTCPEAFCYRGDACIAADFVCDGEIDCRGNEDEDPDNCGLEYVCTSNYKIEGNQLLNYCAGAYCCPEFDFCADDGAGACQDCLGDGGGDLCNAVIACMALYCGGLD